MNPTMNPAQLIPPQDPFGLPAPAWVFVFLLNLTLVVHFILLGYVVTVTLLQVFWAWAAREGSAAQWMERRTERLLPVTLSFAITFGVAPLLFVQTLYQPFFYPSHIVVGYQWFMIFLALIAAFYMIYMLQGGQFLGRRIPWGCNLVGRLLIFLGVLYVLITMTTQSLLAMHPERWSAVRAAGGHTFVLGLSLLWPRLLHNLLAALIIGSVWLITLGVLGGRRGAAAEDAAMSARMVRLGALLGSLFVLLQIIIGLGLIMMDLDVIKELLLSLRPAAILWTLGLIGALLLWAGLIFMLTLRKSGLVTGLWAVLALVLTGMFAGRQGAREITLKPYFSLAEWKVYPQISSLFLFLALFVLALGLLTLMLLWVFRGLPANNVEESRGRTK